MRSILTSYRFTRKFTIKKRLEYWQALEQDISNYAKEQGFPYRINDLPYGRSEKGKPVIVNYFYHEKNTIDKNEAMPD